MGELRLINRVLAMFTDPNLYALLYSTSLALTYLIVRTSKEFGFGSFATAASVNSLCFALYTLARQKSLVDAMVIGLFLGLMFTALSTLMGVFFKQVDRQEPAVSQLATINRR
jgi:ABC-type enterochelin transport system permease subunit